MGASVYLLLHKRDPSFWDGVVLIAPMCKVTLLVLQGKQDVVRDPRMSNALYEQASSRDKTIKLYTGMCHGITTGETDENITLAFVDIIAWLDKHAIKAIVESVKLI
ncbi:hypothetical protein GYH30_026680 [Glycine max]|nr:hypothetical protein GYH30_026680 [Glycine max]